MEITNTKDQKAQFVSYLIAGGSKTGKTVLAATLPSNDMLFINTENNLASLYGANITKIDCFSFQKLVEIVEWLESQNEKPQWLYLDSLSDIAQRLLRDEMHLTKDGRKAYAELNQKIPDIIRRIKSMQLNFVAIAQQGSVKDEITGGVIFGASMPGKELERSIPYMFDAVLFTRIADLGNGDIDYSLQCRGDSQYAAGARTQFDPEGKTVKLDTFEPANLLTVHNKILNKQTN